MKAAIAFLFVALNCYIVHCNVFGKRGSIASGGAEQEFVKNGYTTTGGGHPGIPTISKDCLEKLIKVDVPEALVKLQELLCMFMKGKKDHNEELYRAFLEKVHVAVMDAGCTVDEILSAKDFLENVGDNVGEVAEDIGIKILQLVEDLGLSESVLNCFCSALGETLQSLSESLAGSNGATNVLKPVPLLG